MTDSRTRQLHQDDVPIIDIGSLRDGSDRLGVGEKLAWAASEIGFIYVCNHGIPTATFDFARQAALEFFRLPQELKLRASTNAFHHGYLRPGSTRMDDDAPIDLKESFNWGMESGEIGLAAGPHGEPANPLFGPNTWPPDLPSLKPAVYPYFEAASACAKDLLRGFALAAQLPEEHFTRCSDRPISRGSLQYYPPQPDDVKSPWFGVSAHTDFGMLTVLCQDQLGGLELELPGGGWVGVPPIPDTLVVNVGDLLARWSNGRYRSTPHRVVNTSGRERLSLVLAYDPNYATLVSAADFCRPGQAAQSDPISCGDYLMWRFKKAFAYRQ